jgi:transposase InsO family protein
METEEKVRRKKISCEGTGGGKSKRTVRYSHEFKLKTVKLYLEEGYSTGFIQEQFGVTDSSIHKWVKEYRERGGEGLKPVPRKNAKSKIPPAVKEKIIELKKQDDFWGCRRISNFLRRILFLKASHETIRKTLHEEGLITKPAKPPQRNPARPRFFERSTPNQLWQTDIFTFRLGGQNAYIIGYIDDYSRFITGIGLFRSQTAEHVIEIYRRAITELGKPKELLTDNGRQYTNWRGTTRFELELKKDNIIHIKSRPHHPMTLGKIERFWKSLYVDFLSRAQFENFESAQERFMLWVKYYNYRRPHQGIGGLCPADRYFEIQNEIRKAMESGIQENLLELALRGKPKQSFYMVGRLGDQSISLRAEKGKFKVLTDDIEADEHVQEMIYDLSEGGHNGNGNQKNETHSEVGSLSGNAEMRGSIGNMGRETQTGRDLPGIGGSVGDAEPLAESCAGRNAAGTGTQEKNGERPKTESQAGEVTGKEDTGTEPGENKTGPGETPANDTGIKIETKIA